ncbi:elongator complex protein 4 [Xenopus laevis]|uniref:Elongator complex protein 4 n=1 Tax=Xenopus laevis TaxID=8355 RepID=ELP4_XENLA|nr:elongator complex protein 4 [Xenopus laevis]Q5XG58.1 RecName: Full=Elongator complex protein 4 [Xenopus laevis]AAH84604.1 LOC495207 protein [Xenopus laevis]
MAAPCHRGVSAGDDAVGTGTSFKRKVRGKFPALPGTRPSVHNGQLLVSTGVPSLDHILGGGLAVGTLLLIEEDTYGTYSHLLLKYFLAEGVVSGHEVFVASANDDPTETLQDLPSPLTDEVPRQNDPKRTKDTSGPADDSQEMMKIAWRYQNLPKVETLPISSSRFGHYYDLSKTMPPEMSAKSHRFYLPRIMSANQKQNVSEVTCNYNQLLESIQRVVHQEGYDGSNPQKRPKTILRLGIESLGSVLWADDICSQERPENQHSLTRFLYGLRGLLRTSLSVCVITVPTYLIQNKAITTRLRSLSDTVVGLESFIGSEMEANPLYKDYHGLLHVHQIPRLNSLISDGSDTKDLAFKLKRKIFAIERLHLPPDLSDTVSRSSKQDLAGSAKLLSSGCGPAAGGEKHLDF